MPSTLWSAPAAPTLGASSLTTTSFTASTLSDISPYASLIEPGALNLGTRLRIIAHGSYTGTSTTVTLTWGLYIATPNTAIGSALVFSTGPTVTVVSGTGIPWMFHYYGHIAAVSANINNTSASIVGRGWFAVGTSLTAITFSPMPQTLAAVTVAQTSATNLNTMVELNVMLGVTPGASVTNLTNIISDELTVELVG